MTRTFALIGTVALALVLAACGGSQETGQEAASSPQSEPAPVERPAPETTPAAAPEVQPNDPPSVSADTDEIAQDEKDTAEAGNMDAEAEPENPFAALPAPFNTANYDVGKRTFRLCQSCHLIEEGAGNRVGPNLYGMFDRKVGELEGFNYSSALVEADFDWTPEQLQEWLADPRGFLPGNRMSFAGVRRPDDRTAVIAYIMLESGYGAAE